MKNETRLKRLQSLATLMDSQFQGPFGFRFGLDGLLGLIPVFGDLVTTLASIYILIQAAQMGCTPSTLIRMAVNIAVESIIDMIPVLGSIFDFIWKANNKNISLLERHVQNPRAVTVQSRIFIGVLIISLFSILIVSAYLAFLAFQWLWIFINSF